MRKIRFLLLIAVFVLLCSCSSSEKEVKILTFGHGMNPKHPVAVAIRFFAKRVKEMSDGHLIIRVYPNELLGNETDLVQQVQLGCIDLVKTSASSLSSFIPDYAVLNLPYVFKNKIQFWNVIEGPIGKRILNSGCQYGLKGLTFYDGGARSFYTTKKLIKSPADLKGMKIRVQPSAESIQMVKCLGALPTPLAYGELYTALQQGVVDGAENNVPSLYNSRHYEICKFYSLDEHTRVPDVMLISNVIWQDLSPENQKILLAAAKESLDFQKKLWNKQSREEIAIMKKSGVKIINVDKKPFQEKVQVMYKKLNPEIKNLADSIRKTNDKKLLYSKEVK